MNNVEDRKEKMSIALTSWRNKNKCLSIHSKKGTSNKSRNDSIQVYLK